MSTTLEANSIQPETSPEDMCLMHFWQKGDPTFVHLNATIFCAPIRDFASMSQAIISEAYNLG